MAELTISKKKGQIDKKIEEFCKNSSDLLASIHERCDMKGGSTNPGKGKKRGRKPKKK